MRGIRFTLVTLFLALCFSVPTAFASSSNDKVELTKAQPAMVAAIEADVEYVSVCQAPEAVGSVGNFAECDLTYKQIPADATLTPFRLYSLHRNENSYLNNYTFNRDVCVFHSPQIE